MDIRVSHLINSRGKCFSSIVIGLLLSIFSLIMTSCPEPIDKELFLKVEDSFAPEITIESPEENSYYGSYINFSVTVTDDSISEGDREGSLKSISYTVKNEDSRDDGITISENGIISQAEDGWWEDMDYDSETGMLTFGFSTVSLTDAGDAARDILEDSLDITVRAIDFNGNSTEAKVSLRERVDGLYLNLNEPGTDRINYLLYDRIDLAADLMDFSDSTEPSEEIKKIWWEVPEIQWGGTLDLVTFSNAAEGETPWLEHELSENPPPTYYTAEGIYITENRGASAESYLDEFIYNPANMEITTKIFAINNPTTMTIAVYAEDFNGHISTDFFRLSLNETGPELVLDPAFISGIVRYSRAYYGSAPIKVYGTAAYSNISTFAYFIGSNGDADLDSEYITVNKNDIFLKDDDDNYTTEFVLLINGDNSGSIDPVENDHDLIDLVNGWSGNKMDVFIRLTDSKSVSTERYFAAVLKSSGPSVEISHNLEGSDIPETDEGVRLLKEDDTVILTAVFDGEKSESDKSVINEDNPVFIEQPTSGNEYALTSPYIHIENSDADVIRNDAMIKKDGSNLNWTFEWTVPDANDGEVSVEISAYDDQGNPSESATGEITYIIDNTAPTVVIAGADENGDRISKAGDVVTIVAELSDTYGIDEESVPRFQVDTDPSVDAEMTKIDNLNWTYDWTIPSGNDKVDWEPVVIALDRVGNASSGVTGETVYRIDNTAPAGSQTLDVPAALSALYIGAALESAGFNVVIDFILDDVEDGDKLQLLLDGNEFTTALEKVLDSGDLGSAEIVFTVDSGQLGGDGNKELTARLIDIAGNIGSQSIVYDLILDRVIAQPVISGISNDSGTPSDYYTNDTAVVIFGTAGEPFSTIFINGSDTGETLTDSGAWPSAELSLTSGVNSIALEDRAGNRSINAAQTIELDTTSPTRPVVTSISADTGTYDNDFYTKDSTVLLSGNSGEANAWIYINGIYSGRDLTAAGAWPSGTVALTEGINTVTLVDKAGNGSAGAVQTIELDTLAPAQPVLSAISDDTGTPSDFYTKDPAIVLTGTAGEADAKIYLNGADTGLTLSGSGIWPGGTVDLTEGVNTVTLVDLAENASSTAAQSITLDTAVSAPVITGISNDTGFAAGDFITNDTTVVMSGNSGEANSKIYINGSDSGETLSGTGAWPAIALALSEGVNTVSLVDIAANVSADGSQTITLDTTVAQPVVSGITDDTGTYPDDFYTRDASVVIAGSDGEADAHIYVNGADSGLVMTSGGAWPAGAIALAEGVNTLTQVDIAGNESSGAVQQITLDTGAPAQPVLTAISDDTGTPADFYTNEPIIVLSGTVGEANAKIYLNGTNTGLTLSGTGTWPAGTVNLSDGDNTVTLVDLAENISSDAIQSITLDRTVDAPVITGITDDTGFEGDDFITSDSTVAISGNPGESNSKIYINGFDTGEILSGAGAWPVVSFNLSEGDNTVSLMDIAANVSADGAQTITLDTVVAQPVIDSITDDTGTFSDDFYTKDSSVVISGSGGEANAHIFINGSDTGVTMTAGGNWPAVLPLVEGENIITQVDIAGNVSAAAVQTITLDTSVPAQPVLTAIADDTGTPADFYTKEPSVVLSGTVGEPNAKIYLNGIDTGLTLSGIGEWPGGTVNLTEGENVVALVDLAENVSTAAGQSITLDTSVDAPDITGITDDSGVSGSDFITYDSTVLISGNSGEPNAKIYINGFDTGAVLSGTGAWPVTVFNLSEEVNTVTLIDIADNVSADGAQTITLDTASPMNQDAVFGSSVWKKGGASVGIASSGDVTNEVWFAPTSTSSFTAGATMTKAASGTVETILAPATAGAYKLYVIDRAGNISGESTATLTVDNTAPDNQDAVFGSPEWKKGGASVDIASSGDVTNEVWFAPTSTSSFTAGATMTKAASGTAETILAPATAGAYKLYVIDRAGNISGESTATLTVDNTAPDNQDAVFGSPEWKKGGASVDIASSGDVTNEVWFAPTSTSSFTAGATMTKAASGTAETILAPATAGAYKLYVIDRAGNISGESTATLTVDNTAPDNQDAVFGSPEWKKGGASVDIASSGDVTNEVWFAPTSTSSFTAGATMTKAASGTVETILAPATAGAYKLYVIDRVGNISGESTATLTVDNTAPDNQDAVFGSSEWKKGGASVGIASSGDMTNEVWFAPTSTSSFTAGATMTKAASGTVETILAPATAGAYKLYVIDRAGNISGESTATLTVDNTAPDNQDAVFGSPEWKKGGASVDIASSGDVTNEVWFAPTSTSSFTAGATMTKAASGTAETILAPATAGAYKLYVIDRAGNISGESMATLTVDNTAPDNQDAVFGSPEWKKGGASVDIASSGDVTNEVWFAPTSTSSFTAGATMTKAASGTAETILAPATAGAYKLYVIDRAGNISGESTATLTVDNTAPDNQDAVFGSPEWKKGGASVDIASSGDVTNEVWFAPTSTSSFTAGATMTKAASGTVETILAPATAGAYKLYVIDRAGNISGESTATLTVDNTAPDNQDAVFGSPEWKKGGASVDIASSGDVTNEVWFAPTNTSSFTAGATMTKAASGTAETILAPATAGVYKLYVIDRAGNISGESTATLTVDNTAPTPTNPISTTASIAVADQTELITISLGESLYETATRESFENDDFRYEDSDATGVISGTSEFNHPVGGDYSQVSFKLTWSVVPLGDFTVTLKWAINQSVFDKAGNSGTAPSSSIGFTFFTSGLIPRTIYSNDGGILSSSNIQQDAYAGSNDGINIGGEAELLEIEEDQGFTESQIALYVPTAVKESIFLGVRATSLGRRTSVETINRTTKENPAAEGGTNPVLSEAVVEKASDTAVIEAEAEAEEPMDVEPESKGEADPMLSSEGVETVFTGSAGLPAIKSVTTDIEESDGRKPFSLPMFLALLGLVSAAGFGAFRLFRLFKKRG